eukprot:COSAG04_NODE_2138_length_4717_cov_3.408402_2_plen_835_part_00
MLVSGGQGKGTRPHSHDWVELEKDERIGVGQAAKPTNALGRGIPPKVYYYKRTEAEEQPHTVVDAAETASDAHPSPAAATKPKEEEPDGRGTKRPLEPEDKGARDEEGWTGGAPDPTNRAPPADQPGEAAAAAAEATVAKRRAAGLKTSRYIGVSWVTKILSWRAQIRHDGTTQPLGDYEVEEDAARAFDAAARRLRGDRAHGGRGGAGKMFQLNFPTAAEVAAQEDSSPPVTVSMAAPPKRQRSPPKELVAGPASSKVADPQAPETPVTKKARAQPTPMAGHEGDRVCDLSRLRKVTPADVGLCVEVPIPNEHGVVIWWGGTIRGFCDGKFRVEYDDGSPQKLEALEEDVFFPDPLEEQRCQKPARPKELVMVHDPEEKMQFVCRVVGARPDDRLRVRFIAWQRHHDITVAPKARTKAKGQQYLMEMTAAVQAQAQAFNEQIRKIDRARGEAARARIGSVVTAEGEEGPHTVKDVAIRKPTAKPKAPFAVFYQLQPETDETFTKWVPEDKLLTLSGQALKGSRAAKQAAQAAAEDGAESGALAEAEAAETVQDLAEQATLAQKSSQFVGVSWSKKAVRWKAAISHEGQTQHVGFFVEEEEAAWAYDDAARRLRGGDAHGGTNSSGRRLRLNFPTETEAAPREDTETADSATAAPSKPIGFEGRKPKPGDRVNVWFKAGGSTREPWEGTVTRTQGSRFFVRYGTDGEYAEGVDMARSEWDFVDASPVSGLASPDVDQAANSLPASAGVAQRQAAGQPSSSYVGVSWVKSRRRWYASIYHEGLKQHLGSFAQEEEAARAFDDAARRLRGDEAHGGQAGYGNIWRLNFPEKPDGRA